MINLKKTNEILNDLLIMTQRTNRTLTWVNMINIVTLIVITILMFKGG